MINDQLRGKRVVITGASSGLGFAMAWALGLYGASVLITARNANSLDKALKDLKDNQIDAYSLEMDVRSEQSIINSVQWVEKHWGTPFFIRQKKGKITNITMNHETMKRKGFIPYGPSRAGAESLSLIMAEDLKDYQIDVNMLLSGGATETGMIPDEFKHSLPKNFKLLSPDIMAEPIVFLASDESNGITGQRIVATQFNDWKQNLVRTN
jgi:gluconate 5-dehydrogenase